MSGADGGLDFGVLKVLDETKQTCSLKNKGKFEINFNFAFEATDGSPSDVAQLFTVIPNRGPLLPTDRPTQVQVIFRSKSEITIKDQPVLKCQVSTLSRLIFLICLCSQPVCSNDVIITTKTGSSSNILDQIGNWKCWFLRRGENWSTPRKSSQSKGDNQQQTSVADLGEGPGRPGRPGPPLILRPN